MAVEGKREYKVWLDPGNVEYIRSYLSFGPGSGGISQMLDEYVTKMATTLRQSGVKPGVRMTWAKLARMAIKGVMK